MASKRLIDTRTIRDIFSEMAAAKLTKNKVGRKCSICTHKDQRTINKRIASGDAFRAISRRFGMNHASVTRHTTNCLKLDIAAAIMEKRIEAAVDAVAEFGKNLKFVTKLRTAAEKWLTDPDDPDAFTIDPRADEIDVVYRDGIVPRRESLDVLMARLEGIYNHPSPFVKTVDMREFALKVIDRCDATIDRFAKIDGIYQADRKNLTDEQMARKIADDLIADGWTVPAARAAVYPKYGLPVDEPQVH